MQILMTDSSKKVRKTRKRDLIVIFTLLVSMWCVSRAAAGVIPPLSSHSATFSWTAVPEHTAGNYRLAIGTSSGQYTQYHDVRLASEFRVDGLEFGRTYYAVVTAVGDDGLESPPSVELAFTVAPPPLPAGVELGFDASGGPLLRWSYARAALGTSPEFVIQTSGDLQRWTVLETVIGNPPGGEDGELLRFSRAIDGSAAQKFFRLTARNWMGESTGP
jgi:hypothetical protein